MSLVTFIYSLMIGITINMGLINVYAGIKNKDNKVHFYFGLMSLIAGVFAMFLILAYKSNTLFDFVNFLKMAYSFDLLFYFPLTSFFVYLTGFRNKYIFIGIQLPFALLFFVNIASPYSWYFENIENLITLTILEEELTWGNGTINYFWNYFYKSAAFAFILFGLYCGIYMYKNSLKKRTALYLLGTCLFILGLFIHGEIFVNYLGYDHLYTFDLSPLFLSLFMSVYISRSIVENGLMKPKLIQNENRWRTLLENVQLSVISADPEGKVNYVNPFFLKLTGFKINEVLYHDIANILPLQQYKKNSDRIKDLPSNNKFVNQETILTKKGKKRIIEWSTVEILGIDPKLKGVIRIGADITDRLKAEKELKTAFKELKNLKNRLQEEVVFLQEEITSEHNFGNILGNSMSIKKSLNLVNKVSGSDITVLIEGETGVGKELFARAIHNNSNRNDRIMVKVNCASIPTTLIESELFGHEKGAFTGALKLRKGRFEIADGGTIFLDEIGELPLEIQPKLLRVLQEGEFERVGGNETIKLDVRIITATNRKLKDEVKAGRFREDLFYRLSVFSIAIPPLRERKTDIPLLVEHFVQNFSNKAGKNIVSIPNYTLDLLKIYNWPGNIRELQNVLQRAVINTEGEKLKLSEMLLNPVDTNLEDSDIKSLKEIERNHIIKILNMVKWRIKGEGGAADLLQLNPSTLRFRMSKLDINKPK